MSDDYASWWHESPRDGGLRTALDASSVFRTATDGRRVEVLAHPRLGWVLAIEGHIVHAEEDAGPREMLVHVPLMGHHRHAKRVLVVGGGDGVVLNEVLKHRVDHVDVFEPQTDLVRAAEALGFAALLADARVRLHDTAPKTASFDVVLLARPLISVTEAGSLLASGGVVADWDLAVLTLRGPRWLRRTQPLARLRHEERYMTTSPVLAGGLVGYSLHTVDPQSHGSPRTPFLGRHYNEDLHRAAFALPAFWSELA